jgi:hypothetical protein
MPPGGAGAPAASSAGPAGLAERRLDEAEPVVPHEELLAHEEVGAPKAPRSTASAVFPTSASLKPGAAATSAAPSSPTPPARPASTSGEETSRASTQAARKTAWPKGTNLPWAPAARAQRSARTVGMGKVPGNRSGTPRRRDQRCRSTSMWRPLAGVSSGARLPVALRTPPRRKGRRLALSIGSGPA